MQVAHHGTLHLDGTGYFWYPVAVLAIGELYNAKQSVQLGGTVCVPVGVAAGRLRYYDVVISGGENHNEIRLQ